jgi:hypothetical protein
MPTRSGSYQKEALRISAPLAPPLRSVMSTDHVPPCDAVHAEVYRCTGDRIGDADHVYLDHDDRRPAWVTVTTGLFGTHESFIPLVNAEISGERITVPFSKDHIRDAPTVQLVESHLSVADERSLYAHYGMPAE